MHIKHTGSQMRAVLDPRRQSPALQDAVDEGFFLVGKNPDLDEIYQADAHMWSGPSYPVQGMPPLQLALYVTTGMHVGL